MPIPQRQSSAKLSDLKLESVQLEARTPIEFATSRFPPSKDRHYARITGPQALLDQFSGLGLSAPTCTLSPLAHVNIPLGFRVRAHIPDETEYFAFVYPVNFRESEGAQKLADLDTEHDSLISLCLMGGFAYFDEGGRLLVVNSIVGAEGRGGSRIQANFGAGNFAGGLDFARSCRMGAAAQHSLAREGRLVHVSYPPLQSAGARSFGWIHPLEFTAKQLGAEPAPFGAFAYTEERDGGGEAIYFPVMISSEGEFRAEIEKRVQFALGRLDAGAAGGGDCEAAPDSVAARLTISSPGGSRAPALCRLAGGGTVDMNAVRVLMMIASAGQRDLVETLLQRSPGLLDAADEEGYTPLLRAARGGHTPLVEALVLRGADVSAMRRGGESAMGAALRSGNFDTALALLAPGFRADEGRALHDALSIAADARREAAHLATLDPARSYELRRVSRVAELTAAALLAQLPQERLRAVLTSPQGEAALMRAVQHECKQLLGLPQLQGFLARTWRGGLIEAVVTGEASPPWGAAVRLSARHRVGLALLGALLVAPLNLALLPLVAAAPPLSDAAAAALGRFGALCGRRHQVAARHGYSEALMLYWRALYVLPLPSIKFFVAVAAQLALAACLTALPAADTPPPESAHSVRAWAGALASALRDGALRYWGEATAGLDDAAAGNATALDAALLSGVHVAWPPLPEVGWQQQAALLLVWTLCAIWYEALELVHSTALWAADALNLLELPSLLLAAASLALPLAAGAAAALEPGDEADEAGAARLRAQSQVLLSLALLLMWTAQGLRLLSLLPAVGPLVLMFFKMIKDVTQWLMLVGALLLAFAAAFFAIFKGVRATALEGECAGLDLELGSGVLAAMMVLLEQLLGADPTLDCYELSSYDLTATALGLLYLVVGVILLVNMLIAMMAKSFDLVWEAQALNYQFVFAETVLSWAGKPVAPPPLMLLGLLYQLLRVMLCLPCLVLRRVCGWHRRATRFERLDESEEDGDARQATAGWAERLSTAELQKRVQEHVEAHMEDAGTEERWRAAMAKGLARLERDVQKFNGKFDVAGHHH